MKYETIYLQVYASNEFGLAYKVDRDIYGYNYEGLGIIKGQMTIKELYDYVQKEYGCKKLIIQF